MGMEYIDLHVVVGRFSFSLSRKEGSAIYGPFVADLSRTTQTNHGAQRRLSTTHQRAVHGTYRPSCIHPQPSFAPRAPHLVQPPAALESSSSNQLAASCLLCQRFLTSHLQVRLRHHVPASDFATWPETVKICLKASRGHV